MIGVGSRLICLFVTVVAMAVLAASASADVWTLHGDQGSVWSMAAGVDPVSGDSVLYSVRVGRLFRTSLMSGRTEELVNLEVRGWSDSVFYLAVDRSGKVIVSGGSYGIREYDPASGDLRTISGVVDQRREVVDGSLANARFLWPRYVVVDRLDKIIVVDSAYIREVDRSSDFVKTIAGTGKHGRRDGAARTEAQLVPTGLVVDHENNVIFADYYDAIRKLDRCNETVSTLAGGRGFGFKDGEASNAQFFSPFGLALDGEGNVLITDQLNQRLRKLVLKDQKVITLVGSTQGGDDGPTASAKLSFPRQVVAVPGGIFVSRIGSPHIRFIADEDEHERELVQIVNEGLASAANHNQAGLDDARARLTKLTDTQFDIKQITQAIRQSKQDPSHNLLGTLPRELNTETLRLVTRVAFDGFRARIALERLPVTVRDDRPIRGQDRDVSYTIARAFG